MIYFTSDTHFLHRNIVEYDKRPFTDLEDMTASIIHRWNSIVRSGDTVYHLGDFAISYGKKHEGPIDDILRQLNGQKWLITGNHDRKEVKANKRWVSVTPYHELKVRLAGHDVHKQRIVMSHYAFRTWNQMSRGSWMLHGHSHGNLTDVGGKTLDVGVPSWQYAPVSIDEVSRYMDSREPVKVDHHG